VAHASNEVLVNRPPGEVFAFIADGLNNPKWRPGVLSIELASGSAGQVGAVYRQLIKGPGGRKIDGDYEITRVESGKELSFQVVAGPARPTGSYSLEPAGDATRLRFVLDFQPKGLARLMGPMIQKTMRSEVAQLSALKQVLEGGGA
jgi:carbon monoxide dehydrogenase subunit G